MHACAPSEEHPDAAKQTVFRVSNFNPAHAGLSPPRPFSDFRTSKNSFLAFSASPSAASGFTVRSCPFSLAASSPFMSMMDWRILATFPACSTVSEACTAGEWAVRVQGGPTQCAHGSIWPPCASLSARLTEGISFPGSNTPFSSTSAAKILSASDAMAGSFAASRMAPSMTEASCSAEATASRRLAAPCPDLPLHTVQLGLVMTGPDGLTLGRTRQGAPSLDRNIEMLMNDWMWTRQRIPTIRFVLCGMTIRPYF